MKLRRLVPYVFLATLGVATIYATVNSERNVKRNKIKSVCSEIGFDDIDEVSVAWKYDVNNDGLKDIVLELKDGRRLEYLCQGYKLKD
ncbi:MAG TPA: hypothetical protein VJH92_04935 [Candidatus Nanoarchaeia archaeon]|nr:hypothetical protein [Candidatus Nanoarchaeia archaeon]